MSAKEVAEHVKAYKAKAAKLRIEEAKLAARANDVETDRDYNVGLRNVRSQRKAHWVETHAALALPGAEEWDCASFDGYMCECRRRPVAGEVQRAHRCRRSIAAACFDEGGSANA